MKCSQKHCGQDAIWRFDTVRNRTLFGGNDAFCEEHARLHWDFCISDQRKGVGTVINVSGTVSMELELVITEFICHSAKVLLREVNGARLIFFPIAFVQCYELLWAVQDSPYNNLSVHYVLKQLVEHDGGKLSHVILDGLSHTGYFEANAIIQRPSEVIKIPIHAANGLVLAMMTKIPFLVAEELFSRTHEWHKWGNWTGKGDKFAL